MSVSHPNCWGGLMILLGMDVAIYSGSTWSWASSSSYLHLEFVVVAQIPPPQYRTPPLYEHLQLANAFTIFSYLILSIYPSLDYVWQEKWLNCSEQEKTNIQLSCCGLMLSLHYHLLFGLPFSCGLWPEYETARRLYLFFWGKARRFVQIIKVRVFHIYRHLLEKIIKFMSNMINTQNHKGICHISHARPKRLLICNHIYR